MGLIGVAGVKGLIGWHTIQGVDTVLADSSGYRSSLTTLMTPTALRTLITLLTLIDLATFRAVRALIDQSACIAI